MQRALAVDFIGADSASQSPAWVRLGANLEMQVLIQVFHAVRITGVPGIPDDLPFADRIAVFYQNALKVRVKGKVGLRSNHKLLIY